MKLHKYIYDDLYYFAGCLRDENVVFNDFMSCQYEIIDMCLNDLFDKDYSKFNIKDVLTYLMTELYIILPFRDGNNTTINKFLEDYAFSRGYTICLPKDIKNEIKAAYYGDSSNLYDKIAKALPYNI